MARRTDGEKIDELQTAAAMHEVGLRAVEKRLDALDNADSGHREFRREVDQKLAELRREHGQQLADVRREYDREVAVLQHEVAELRAWREESRREREERGRRAWAFGPSVAAAVVNVALSAAVAYLVARR